MRRFNYVKSTGVYSRFNIAITKDQIVELKLPKYSISERELRCLCPELPFPQQPLTKYAKTGAKNVLRQIRQYGKNCYHQQITQYNTFWDNFRAFSAWSMV